MTQRDLILQEVDSVKQQMLALLANASLYADKDQATEDFWILVQEYDDLQRKLASPDADDPVRQVDSTTSLSEAIQLSQEDARLKKLFSVEPPEIGPSETV